MSNSILPHLLSDSPPPLVADDEDFEDEFGDFKGTEELSFDNENLSPPSSLKNPSDYFPDSFNNFNICNVEDRYQIIETTEDKVPNNTRIPNPPNNYFNLWEQIENNIPEIVDAVEDQQNDAKEIVNSVGNGKDTVYHSNENNCKEETNLKNDIPFESTEHSCDDITENDTYSEISKSLEENGVSNDIKLSNENISIQNNDGNEIKLSDVNLEPVIDSLEIEKCDDEDLAEERDEKLNEDDQLSVSVGDFSLHDEYSSFDFQDADNSESSKEMQNEVLNEPEEQQAEISIVKDDASGDDFGKFADFSSLKINDNQILQNEVNCAETEENSDFDEFESYQTSNVPKIDIVSSKSCDLTTEPVVSTEDANAEDFDEFDDFTSYSKHADESTEVCKQSNASDTLLKICKSPEEAFRETQNILEKIFPVTEFSTPEYSNFDFITNNSVFEILKDITETNALTYQWGKSTAQKNILKTLNIDIRNILYGPTWNSGMPIFAPNLCSKPLEPIKSELPIPISPQKTIESQESTTSTAPQFDWSGSGLTNLQDSPLNADKASDTTLQTPIGEFELIKPTYVDPTPISQDTSNFEEELTQSRYLEDINNVTEHQEINDDFSDFTSYQGKVEKETKWKNMLPLRESHISTNEEQGIVETDKISIYFQELTGGKSVVNNYLTSNSKKMSSESSFEFFETDQFPAESSSMVNELKKIEQKTKLEELPQSITLESNEYFEANVSNHCDKSLDDFSSFKTEETKQIQDDTMFEDESTKHQEDEFSDFQSSLPCEPKSSVQPSFLQPLQPAILQPATVKDKTLKIEWPEPGLDEDEINRIVNGVLRKNSKTENVLEKPNNPVQTESNPSNVVQKNDHDDWSDFISVKEPLKSRTSTPDLPLSVFNLGSIQPSKVSAPFVAPNGVVHSPSKTPNIGIPLARNLQSGSQQSHHHPFITSQAFDAFYSNTKNHILQPGTSRKLAVAQQNSYQFSYNDKMNSASCLEQNTGHFPQSVRNHKDHKSSSNAEDDDWGDFVSAPNTIANSSGNFFQPLSYMKKNLGFGPKAVPTQKFPTVARNTVVKQDKNNFPVISTMPDLDFVSPKSRSSIK